MIPDCLSQETALRQYGQEMWAEGFKQGFRQGYKQGYKRGYKQGKLEVLRSLLDKGKITEEIAARETGMTVEDFREAQLILSSASGHE